MSAFANLLLCVTEDDDAAVRRVARLAAATGAGLTLVDVVEDIPPIARRLLPQSWNLPALVRAQKQAQLERGAGRARRLGVGPRTVLLRGSPIRALVREVVRGGHDLVAVRAAPSGTVPCIGASATRLLRECPCPVLLLHPTRLRRRPRVLVAVDSGPRVSDGADALTAKLFECARWFAETHGGEVHVLHAWAPFGERLLRGGGLADAEVRQFVASMHEQTYQDLERTIAPFRAHVAPGGVHLVQGDPNRVIADVATTHQVDLLVVGTVARSGVAARIVGNTAEAVLSQLPCSMLVVKPDDRGARRRRSTQESTERSQQTTA